MSKPAEPPMPAAGHGDARHAVDYAALTLELDALLGAEPDRIANAANTAALLYLRLPDVSWAGFYFATPPPGAGAERELVLGPFQGKPACVRIAWGKGVCGTAALRGQALVVDDVHAFDGHIACDPQSRSEVVLPLIDAAGEPIGVLDLDSTAPARFTLQDRDGLAAVATVFMRAWERGGAGSG
jgi:L-methionine (R)-S-oxide reductase